MTSRGPTRAVTHKSHSKYRGPQAEQIDQAARLCHEDELTDEGIAASFGLCRRTLARWKKRPDFKAIKERLDTERHERIRQELMDTWRAILLRPR